MIIQKRTVSPFCYSHSPIGLMSLPSDLLRYLFTKFLSEDMQVVSKLVCLRLRNIIHLKPFQGKNILNAAADRGHLNICKWARANGAPWDEGVYYSARKKGHQKIVDWALANGAPPRHKKWVKIAEPDDADAAKDPWCRRLCFEDFSGVWDAFRNALGFSLHRLERLDVTNCSIYSDDFSRSLLNPYYTPKWIKKVNFSGCHDISLSDLGQFCELSPELKVLKAILESEPFQKDQSCPKKFFESLPGRLTVLDLRNRPIELTESLITTIVRNFSIRKLALSVVFTPGAIASASAFGAFYSSPCEELWLQSEHFPEEDFQQLSELFPNLRNLTIDCDKLKINEIALPKFKYLTEFVITPAAFKANELVLNECNIEIKNQIPILNLEAEKLYTSHDHK